MLPPLLDISLFFTLIFTSLLLFRLLADFQRLIQP